MIITRSPLRISLGGAGTDLPSLLAEQDQKTRDGDSEGALLVTRS